MRLVILSDLEEHNVSNMERLAFFGDVGKYPGSDDASGF